MRKGPINKSSTFNHTTGPLDLLASFMSHLDNLKRFSIYTNEFVADWVYG